MLAVSSGGDGKLAASIGDGSDCGCGCECGCGFGCVTLSDKQLSTSITTIIGRDNPALGEESLDKNGIEAAIIADAVDVTTR
eukprot:m.85680 g.85680  ORF g.85680 m.85680 type:complete len:82 (-) comp14730_c0_seq1:132-377(-)